MLNQLASPAQAEEQLTVERGELMYITQIC